MNSLTNILKAIDVITRHASIIIRPSLIYRNFMTLYREIDLLIISKILFSQPLFFKRISGYPFTRGLSPSDISQRGATARVFKTARNGWLYAEESNDDVTVYLRTKIIIYIAALFS
ncbi:hypothetical protein DTO021D3_2140 [Paecilomyces variotii]|nr:hypothetical protein DTO032I3_1753 [Paecilomyces variotii]KAJ9281086.1 hypothetical protein DTO021D3_2140 [Paecilomyces variotii]KAJ9345459.1 hypothetical protein DTO027B6_1990 [Paecilomyces variotii]KAJ9386054.1 hypothetical protein DTO032I4_3785 [Paecilomyces variotii]